MFPGPSASLQRLCPPPHCQPLILRLPRALGRDADQTILVPMFTFGERELLADTLREHTVQCSSAKALLVKVQPQLLAYPFPALGLP